MTYTAYGGSENQILEIAVAVCAHNQQIELAFVDDFGDGLSGFAKTEFGFYREAFV